MRVFPYHKDYIAIQYKSYDFTYYAVYTANNLELPIKDSLPNYLLRYSQNQME